MNIEYVKCGNHLPVGMATVALPVEEANSDCKQASKEPPPLTGQGTGYAALGLLGYAYDPQAAGAAAHQGTIPARG